MKVNISNRVIIKELSELVNIDGGYAFKSDEFVPNKTPIIRIGNIVDGNVEIDYSIGYNTEAKNFDRYLINKNDILIAMSGATTGKLAMYRNKDIALLNQRVGRFYVLDNNMLDNNYLYYYLRSDFVQGKIKIMASGCAQPNISPKQLLSIHISVPLLETQKKIVEVLEKAEKALEKRKEVIRLLDELAKSRFIEMFGDPITNPKCWNKAKLGDICTISRGGSPRPIDKFLGGPVPWIKIGDATQGDDIYLHKTKEGIIEEGIKKSRLIKKGGLIFANCGVSLGFARILKIDGCIHDGWLAFEGFDDYLDKIFFLKSLNYCTEYFRRIAPDGTQPNLNTNIMREYIQILPPIAKQKEYTKFIEQVDKLKFEMQKSLTQLEDNFNSLMQRAFKGELFN